MSHEMSSFNSDFFQGDSNILSNQWIRQKISLTLTPMTTVNRSQNVWQLQKMLDTVVILNSSMAKARLGKIVSGFDFFLKKFIYSTLNCFYNIDPRGKSTLKLRATPQI